jgi:hypothetical protein
VTPSTTHIGPGWERAAFDADEARIRLRDRAGKALDRAAPDTSLRFCCGLGAKSNCKVEDTLRWRDPCSIQIESH